LAQTYEPGSDKLNALFESAAKVYPNDEVANLNAANAAMQKGDYAKALNYLSKAGNRPEAIYARGVLEVLREDFSAATIYLEEAKRMGVAQAEPIIEAIANYWKVSMTK
jgi:tetratricopeptide (TPR) repeat protein